MCGIIIRKTEEKDIPAVMDIFAYAREFMKSTGNPDQWGDTWPERWAVEEDIKNGTGFVMEENGRIFATFAFIIGEDYTYRVIEDFSGWPEIYRKMRACEIAGSHGAGHELDDRTFGRWLNDGQYGTIHRLAGDGTHKKVFERCLEFCEKQCANVRADTYEDNKILQHKLGKNGFVPCGVIYVRDQAPRIAYHKVEANKQEAGREISGLNVRLEPKIVRIDNDETLAGLLNCRKNAFAIAERMLESYKEKYGTDLKISKRSLAVEIYGHYYILVKADAFEAKHGSRKFTRWLKRHMDVIDCGEKDVDNNRLAWDILQFFWRFYK